MANGVEDDAEAEYWNSRTRDLLESMGEYVKSRGETPAAARRRPPPATAGGSGATPTFTAATPPAAAVELHAFPVSRNRGAGGDANEGGGEGPPDNLWVAEHVGLPLCRALAAYRGVSDD